MAKRGLGKGLGAFFGEEVANTKETSGEKVSRSERLSLIHISEPTRPY